MDPSDPVADAGAAVEQGEPDRSPDEGSTPEDRRERLVSLYREASACTRCPLSETRNSVVFGAGNADADLMFVGEGPGAQEDRQGLPFVGRAGGLLNELLAGIGLAREDVFVSNTVKCRPPGNRDPHPAEIEACSGYLDRQLELIRPRVVATLGNFATRLLTRSRDPISRVRGTPQLHTLAGRQVLIFPVFHPAAALRTPSLRDSLEQDFASIRELLDRPLPDSPLAPDPGADPSVAPDLRRPPEPRAAPDPGAADNRVEAADPKPVDQLDIFG
jgi:DNA polymerase